MMPRSWVILVLLCQSCGPAVVYESLEADAERYCLVLAVCEEIPSPADYAARCANDVVDHGDVALDEGNACARSLEVLVHCFADMSCQDHKDWRALYANDMQSITYPCDEQTDDFLADCEKAWFAVNIRR